jgi:hypothetical protein
LVNKMEIAMSDKKIENLMTFKEQCEFMKDQLKLLRKKASAAAKSRDCFFPEYVEGFTYGILRRVEGE